MKFYITPENKYVVEKENRDFQSYCDQDNHIIVEPKTYDEEPTIYSISINNFISHFENKDGVRMSVEEFNRRRDELLFKRYEDEDGDFHWENLEDEFKYRSFIETWKPVKFDRTNKKKIEDICWEIHRKPKSKYIKTSYYYGDPKETTAWIGVKEVFSKILREKLNKIGFIETKEMSLGSKIPKGNYKLYDFKDSISVYLNGGSINYDRKENQWKSRGTLEEMESVVKEIEEYIDKKLKSIVYGDKHITNSEFLEGLKSIKNLLGKIEVYKKSIQDYHLLKKRISELEKDVEDSILESVKII